MENGSSLALGSRPSHWIFVSIFLAKENLNIGLQHMFISSWINVCIMPWATSGKDLAPGPLCPKFHSLTQWEWDLFLLHVMGIPFNVSKKILVSSKWREYLALFSFVVAVYSRYNHAGCIISLDPQHTGPCFTLFF